MTIIQRTPDIAITLRMQRLPKAIATQSGGEDPGGGGDDDIIGAGWFLPTLMDRSDAYTLVSESLPGGRWKIQEATEYGLKSSIWEGTPVVVEDGVVRPVPGPGFRCVELTVESTYYVDFPGWTYFGALQGATMTDAHWVLEWSSPSIGDPLVSAMGHKASTYANVVQVELFHTGTGTGAEELLTARAFSSGVQVAELRLIAIAIAA